MTTLPKSPWSKLISHVKKKVFGEPGNIHPDDLTFLKNLGYLDELTDRPTQKANNLIHLIEVRREIATAKMIILDDVISQPATQFILQSLDGLGVVSVDQVYAALILAGIDANEVNEKGNNFISILNSTGVVIYNKKERRVKLLHSPKKGFAPPHIFIDKDRPYANDIWVREILRECVGGMLWLDKYFAKEAFEWLWREADASKISSIRIVSTTDENGVEATALSDYNRLKKELAKKGVVLEWRSFSRKEAHGFHDRWLMDEEGLVYNLPSIHSIHSGQKSEIHRSSNYREVRNIFDEYYAKATPVS